jgi:hypothetical protein
MKIGKSLQKFDSIIYEGVITPFHLEYFIKKSLWEQLLLCKWEFLKTMHYCLLQYEYSHVVTAVLLDILCFCVKNVKK